MSVRRDKRTGHWIFQTTVKYADGTRKRIFGTPGIPGPYHDLARTRVGALEAERRAISEAMLGKPVVAAATEAPKTKTISEDADIFLRLYKPESKPTTHRDRSRSMKHLLPHFGGLSPDDVQQQHVDAFVKAQLKRGAARKSINNRLGVLSSLLQYLTGEPSRLRLNIGGMAAQIHAVDPADVERLLAACTDVRYRAVILLASEAGLRIGEIRGLQWTDIKDGQLTVRRALDQETSEVVSPKHDKVRTVPLSPRVTEVLAMLPRRGLWVVCRRDGRFVDYYKVSEAIKAIYDRAEVTRPTKPLHCLRHSFGTVMARRVPLGTLQKLMGHAQVTTTMRYVDVSEDDKRDAIALVFGASHAQADSAKGT